LPRPFEDSRDSALRQAYKLLSYRDRSEKEIIDRLLLKGFSRGIAEDAVAFLNNKGFINDRKTAESFRRYAVENKGLGRKGVVQYLVNRGIPEDIAEETAGEESDYLDTAKRIVEKRLVLVKDCDAGTVRRRLWGLLLRRGFTGETISILMKDIIPKEE